MLKTIGPLLFATLLLVSSTVVHGATRYNPYTGYWEGNVCNSPQGWTWYAWQPIGSMCTIRLPNGMFIQGIIANA